MSLLNLLLRVVLALWAVAEEVPPKAPVAPTKAHSTDFHGMRLEDPYFWMKDKTNPDVIGYLEAEKSCRDSVTQHLGPLAETLYREMLSHLRQTDLGVPVFERGYWYYSRTAAKCWCMRSRMSCTRWALTGLVTGSI